MDQSYNHTANQNKAANVVALKEWIESHTPEQINAANNARVQLKKKLQLKNTHKYAHLQDPRIPKKPFHARLHFVQDRFATGDFKGVKVPDANSLITKEWHELPAGEKKVCIHMNRLHAGSLHITGL